METTSLSTAPNFLPLTLAAKIPAGDYHVLLTDAVRDGRYLRSRFRILRGPYIGQLVYLVTDFDDFKSKQLFQQWCRSAGNWTPKDTADLAKPVLVTVKQRMVDGVSVPMVVKFARALEGGL